MFDIMLTFWWPSCYVGWSVGIVCGALFDPWCRRVVLGATLAVLKLMCVFRSSEGQEPYVYQTFSKLFPPSSWKWLCPPTIACKMRVCQLRYLNFSKKQFPERKKRHSLTSLPSLYPSHFSILLPLSLCLISLFLFPLLFSLVVCSGGTSEDTSSGFGWNSNPFTSRWVRPSRYSR